MSFFKNLRSELGTSIGRGIANIFHLLWIILLACCKWLISYEHKQGEHFMRTNSLRIGAASFILLLIFTPGLISIGNPSGSSTPQKRATQPEVQVTQTLRRIMNLTKMVPIGIPSADDFKILDATDAKYYEEVFDETGKTLKLFYYQKTTDGLPYGIIADEIDSCYRVPFGMRLHLRTRFPPRLAFNMRGQVTYYKRIVETNRYERFLTAIQGRENTPTTLYDGETLSWENLHDTWVQLPKGQERLLIIEALPLDKIPQKNYGGVVCV